MCLLQESDHSDSHEQRQVMGAGKKDASGKEKMTKAQKRRHFDKFGAGSEKPRGWDWVPILSHVRLLLFSVVLLNQSGVIIVLSSR